MLTVLTEEIGARRLSAAELEAEGVL